MDNFTERIKAASKGIVTIGEFQGHYKDFKKSSDSNNSTRKYYFPEFIEEVECILQCGKDWSKNRSVNLMLTGPHGVGKTEFVNEIATRCGFSKVFHVNGREDMCSGDFLGEQTVEIDLKTLQNRITFRKGPLYKAFIEGTQVDENGNQILDKNGNPIVTGKPGIFFLDEFAVLLPGVFLSVFNRVMEIPRNAGESRSLEISMDGGRVIKSHPGFAMILSGNTVGKGTESESTMGYTAQNNIMDDSTLNRITAIYEFYFNLPAEEEIIAIAFQDEKLVKKFFNFVNSSRELFFKNKISTLISTRTIVNVMDVYERLLPLYNHQEALKIALKRSLFAGLREHEIQAWKELSRSEIGINIWY